MARSSIITKTHLTTLTHKVDFITITQHDNISGEDHKVVLTPTELEKLISMITEKPLRV